MKIHILLIISLLLSCSSTNKTIHEIEVLSAGWANAERTVVRLKEVAQEMKIKINVIHTNIKTKEDAQIKGMHGSPSVHINGIDIEPKIRNSFHVFHTWRIYDGVSGIPPKKMIIRAFKEAMWIN